MNYMEMMRRQESTRIALVEEGVEYSYGQIVMLAQQMSNNSTIFPSKCYAGRTHWICREKIAEQLIEFLAASERGEIPVIIPLDQKMLRKKAETELTEGKTLRKGTGIMPQDENMSQNDTDILSDTESKQQGIFCRDVCMGVMTSGSTGEPKVWYRTYESWAGFFETQNSIFGIDRNTRLFAQGSLAFSGNLNMYLAVFAVGGRVIAENKFRPREWENLMEQNDVNTIYLIPSKLMCTPRVMQRRHSEIQTILSGSQGMNRADVQKLKQYFPDATMTLYYGASELSYVTYIRDTEMTEDRGLVGKPFPGVHIQVQNQQIYVTTPFSVWGIKCPYSVSDRGYLDQENRLHFIGRSDSVVEVHGRKVSLWYIENILMKQPEIQLAAVLNLMDSRGKERRVAFVVLQAQGQIHPALISNLRKDLANYEMPARIIPLPEIPMKESGKVDTEKLQDIWREMFTEKEKNCQ